jgi:predicted DNA-binding protein with PD1-like motif
MLVTSATLKRLVLIRLNPGDDILPSLQAAVDREGLRDALILNGTGSVSSYHFHVVETTQLPPGNVYVKGEGPYDILAMSGLVLAGRVHAHIVFGNTQQALGGHLEAGCRVLTFCTVALAETSGVDLAGWDAPGARLG